MKQLDRYILKKFLTTFFFSIFLFAVIAIVVDVSEKTEDFGRSGLGIKRIITDYYYGFVPHIIALLFPLFVFIAVIFFTSKMAGKSEIIAILASGTSYGRWLRPYWIGGIFLAVILWFANQYVVPRANKIRGAFEANYIDRNSTYNALLNTSSNIYLRIDSFTYAGIYSYDTLSKRGGPMFLYKVKQGKVVENKRADVIQWDTATRKWKLESVIDRKIDVLKEHITLTSTEVEGFSFKPLDLSRDKYTKDKLTTPELDRFIALEELRGSEGLNDLKVERYRRDATSVTVLLLTLIGAIIAGRKVRGGSGVHLAVGFMIAALFIITDRFSTIFSTKGNLPPLIAAWIPNLIFVFVVIYLYRKAPK
ncbi:LptF/LptG family permease [Sediminibacterium ginsengisoli]|uniref:Lipopolysaccharide export system permease protein n=1 Tax=Sediminibacterium ginsengisoli TaxID=413434 RepID=A0A1T4KSB8_9BACT|nr:LptF/LptG family permease [Sediminibacterium ginsengisoli]SJZ45238.1 lipopolysaccharide export system permease protein [Sediminibacterium ginsengisoli]